MSFCPKCGREILDESLGCPVCNVKENKMPSGEEKAEVVQEFTVEDKDGSSQKFQSESEARDWGDYRSAETKPVQEQTVPTILKVIVVIAVIVAGGIGQIAGLVAGIVLLKSPIEDYRKFGKTLITISCIMLAIWFLCCIVGGLFNVAGSMMYYTLY